MGKARMAYPPRAKTYRFRRRRRGAEMRVRCFAGQLAPKRLVGRRLSTYDEHRDRYKCSRGGRRRSRAIRSRTRSCLGAVFGVTSQQEKGLSEQRSSNLRRRCTRSKTRKSLFARNYLAPKKKSAESAPRAASRTSEPLQRNQLSPAPNLEAQRR